MPHRFVAKSDLRRRHLYDDFAERHRVRHILFVRRRFYTTILKFFMRNAGQSWYKEGIYGNCHNVFGAFWFRLRHRHHRAWMLEYHYARQAEGVNVLFRYGYEPLDEEEIQRAADYHSNFINEWVAELGGGVSPEQ